MPPGEPAGTRPLPHPPYGCSAPVPPHGLSQRLSPSPPLQTRKSQMQPSCSWYFWCVFAPRELGTFQLSCSDAVSQEIQPSHRSLRAATEQASREHPLRRGWCTGGLCWKEKAGCEAPRVLSHLGSHSGVKDTTKKLRFTPLGHGQVAPAGAEHPAFHPARPSQCAVRLGPSLLRAAIMLRDLGGF